MSLLVDDRSPAPGEGFEIALSFRPLLESWDRKAARSQVRLEEYRQKIAALAAPALAGLEPPLALGFYVAGREEVARGCDLDNFLTPVVKALGGGNAFSFVWAERGRVDDVSRLTLLEASDTRLDFAGEPSHVAARLTGSYEKEAWKAALAAAAGRHESAMRSGPVELGIRFGVSPERTNWVALWKPAIDALGGILGDGDGCWNPNDDRISLLVLQRQLRIELGWDVQLDVWWAEQT